MSDPRPLSRRRFLQASGAAVVGTALGGGLVLESVGEVLAARLPTVAVARAGAPLFAGPGNVDFALLGTLAKGQKVVPSGAYGDFVRVTALALTGADGRPIARSTSGYVQRSDLAKLPAGVPTLPVTKVPWASVPLVPASRPMVMPSVGMLLDGYKVYILLDGTWYATRDLRVDVDLAFASHEGIRRTSSSGLHLQNWTATRDPDHTALIALEHNGHPSDLGWYFGYSPGTDWEFYDRLPLPKSRTTGRLSLWVDGRGHAVSLVLPDGSRHGYTLKTPLFRQGDVLSLAFNDAPYTDMTARTLTLSRAPTGRRQPPLAPYGSLREHAAKAGVTVGMAVDTWRPDPDPRYEQIVARQFDLVVPSGEFNWDWQIRPDATHYAFGGADEQVSFAQRHGQRVRGYLLPSGSDPAGLPAWLKDSSYTRDQLLMLVRDHINTVVGRYKGVIAEWLVASETIFEGSFVPWNFWLTKVGPDFIDKVFTWAREADPAATLFYEFSSDEWTPPQATAIHAHIADLKARGIPVDVLGYEMHVFDATTAPTKQTLLDQFRALGALGVGVAIMEMDVNVHPLSGTLADKLAVQARIYRDALEALLESGVGRSFTPWGLTDSASWLFLPAIEQVYGKAEAPLLFDDDFAPKPAYYAVLDALKAAAR